jgi:zinc transporter ZupT
MKACVLTITLLRLVHHKRGVTATGDIAMGPRQPMAMFPASYCMIPPPRTTSCQDDLRRWHLRCRRTQRGTRWTATTRISIYDQTSLVHSSTTKKTNQVFSSILMLTSRVTLPETSPQTLRRRQKRRIGNSYCNAYCSKQASCSGTSFAVLLVAISFHQTFEGFALGSRISAIQFPAGSLKPWLMALAYGTTTPIGQAIGLAIHTLYDPASQIGLLTVGFMNAISSGLLLFAGLVELLAEDFLSDESYVTLQGKRRLQACASVVGGAALMALVGAWA